MISVNTNLYAMKSRNYERLNLLEFNNKVEHLSSGTRVNRGADDPSGLAISSGMKAQARSMQMAIQNIQDTVNLLKTAEGGIEEVHQALLRIRDLSVKLANQAVLDSNPKEDATYPPLPSDSRRIKDEIANLREAIEQLSTLTDFNGKGGSRLSTAAAPIGLLYGTFAEGLQHSQIGPDNVIEDTLGITIPSLANLVSSLNATVNPLDPSPDADAQVWADFAQNLLADIDETNATIPQNMRFGIPSLAQVRGDIGALQTRLSHALEDLQVEYMNLMGTRSRIVDSDMAQEATQMSVNMIKQQSATAAATQANAEPLIATQLLGAIYDGMIGGPFSALQG